MTAWMMTAVSQIGFLAGRERDVMMVLCDHAGDEGERMGVCWPSKELITSEAGVKSESTVDLAINVLEALGCISIARAGGRGKSNTYRVNIKWLRHEQFRAQQYKSDLREKKPTGWLRDWNKFVAAEHEALYRDGVPVNLMPNSVPITMYPDAEKIAAVLSKGQRAAKTKAKPTGKNPPRLGGFKAAQEGDDLPTDVENGGEGGDDEKVNTPRENSNTPRGCTQYPPSARGGTIEPINPYAHASDDTPEIVENNGRVDQSEDPPPVADGQTAGPCEGKGDRKPGKYDGRPQYALRQATIWWLSTGRWSNIPGYTHDMGPEPDADGYRLPWVQIQTIFDRVLAPIERGELLEQDHNTFQARHLKDSLKGEFKPVIIARIGVLERVLNAKAASLEEAVVGHADEKYPDQLLA